MIDPDLICLYKTRFNINLAKLTSVSKDWQNTIKIFTLHHKCDRKTHMNYQQIILLFTNLKKKIEYVITLN